MKNNKKNYEWNSRRLPDLIELKRKDITMVIGLLTRQTLLCRHVERFGVLTTSLEVASKKRKPKP